VIVIVMGVSGSGKTTLGKALAARLGWPFLEGDDLHPARNRAKMAAGHPLDDSDRRPWLEAIAAWMAARAAEGGDAVVACSALRRSYRDLLAAAAPDVLFAWLDGPRAVLQARLSARKGHFMPPSLLDSQIDTLEPPGPDETAVRIDLELPLDRQVAAAAAAVQARGNTSSNAASSRARLAGTSSSLSRPNRPSRKLR
jgi:gluconokinase